MLSVVFDERLVLFLVLMHMLGWDVVGWKFPALGTLCHVILGVVESCKFLEILGTLKIPMRIDDLRRPDDIINPMLSKPNPKEFL